MMMMMMDDDDDNNEVSLCLTKYHAIKSRGIELYILKLGTRWR